MKLAQGDYGRTTQLIYLSESQFEIEKTTNKYLLVTKKKEKKIDWKWDEKNNIFV